MHVISLLGIKLLWKGIMLMTSVYVGYHGTNKCAAESIVNSKSFRPSLGDDEWLGKGVYFYWDSDDAHWWCVEHEKLELYTILKAQIVCNELIDLAHTKRDIEQFKEFCKMVANRCEKLSNGEKRKNYMSLALKLMVRERPPDIIIGGFDQNRKFWFTNQGMKEKFPLTMSQIQICVLKNSCIRDIDIYEEVG